MLADAQLADLHNLVDTRRMPLLAECEQGIRLFCGAGWLRHILPPVGEFSLIPPFSPQPACFQTASGWGVSLHFATFSPACFS